HINTLRGLLGKQAKGAIGLEGNTVPVALSALCRDIECSHLVGLALGEITQRREGIHGFLFPADSYCLNHPALMFLQGRKAVVPVALEPDLLADNILVRTIAVPGLGQGFSYSCLGLIRL